jgi:hypothetical protein
VRIICSQIAQIPAENYGITSLDHRTRDFQDYDGLIRRKTTIRRIKFDSERLLKKEKD